MLSKRLFLTPWMGIGPKSKRCAHGGQSFNVAVIGAAGGIGQPLSMLLRTNPLVSKLTLYDLKFAVGVAADVSHIDASGTTKGVECAENLKKALGCAELVVVPAGMPRKPGQTRDDLFKVNADIVAGIMEAAAKVCPTAFFAIITNPVNSTVPVAAEILKKHKVYDPARLFGVTTLDTVRARKFIGDKLGVLPKRVKIEVVGGHSASTIVPVISDCEPNFRYDHDEAVKICERIRNGGTEVVEAKAGSGSATLSMAYAGSLFVNSLLRAMNGELNVSDVAYVDSCLTEAQFFASRVQLGPAGVTDLPALPEFNAYEKDLICQAMPDLIADIKKGIEHGQAYKAPESKA